ncbi:MAG: class I SAM-dependent methyltransferase [Nanoarchaeota archaeon]
MKDISKGYKQYSKELVESWDEDLINWKKREEGEGDFFINILKKNNVKTVLDISLGTGYDSIKLIKTGFIVKSCDGNKEMINKAIENADKHKVRLDVKQCEWSKLVENYNEKFDAIICLGNSFTHLFSEKDRESVINQIYFLLNNNGVLVIDQRNYDYLLSHDYKSKHKYYYCGNNIKIDIIYRSNNLIKIKYTKKGNGFFTLDLYPIRIEEMKSLIKKVGFGSIKTYGDFEENFDLDNTDFIQHIAIK